MYLKNKHILFMAYFLFALTGGQEIRAQFSAPYTDSWITYDKAYVKIGINKKGLHRIPFSSLPKSLVTTSPEKLQLWRRGKQVSIISTANNEIVFYAVTNDGAPDSLLYRPMSSRLNPYFSMYSDEGSYFLTNGETAGARAKVVNQAVDAKLQPMVSHDELATTIFNQEYSLSASTSISKDHKNSYFELGASRTGVTTKIGTTLRHNISLINVADKLSKASIKLFVHGRSNNEHRIEVYIGKDTTAMRLVNTIKNNGFEGTEYTFELKPGDVDASYKGILALKVAGSERLDRFSLAYYSIGYSQSVDMAGLSSKEFRLSSGTVPWNRLQISGVPINSAALDITNADDPILIQGAFDNLMVPRVSGKTLTLLATKEVITVPAEKLKEVTFKTIDVKNPNYIIVTTDNLLTGATQYATYRASQEGGSFKPLVVNIKDIYDQFNYGEPSPLGIKRFMAYVLGQGGKDKYLFLIGKSITYAERMVRELPDEVPSLGYPASDILLVSGLNGGDQDIPAIPVGRLSAISNQNILDYLQKIKEYEQNTTGDYGWRKNFLHLNGGKNVGEITQLRDLLGGLVPTVEDGVAGGKVTPYVKQQAMAETESVNITPDVNNGVGLITYFGHGAVTITDLDMGYITDVSRGYSNPGKYPMMYFNGCGVGNVFQNRFNANPNAGDRLPLSLDWLMAPKRGAIAVIANSFESFVSPSARYLEQLYANMFVEPATVNLSIGKIQVAVANALISKTRDEYTVSNAHQSLLQGDPALKVVTVDKPDYSLNPQESITLYSKSGALNFEKSDSIRVGVYLSNEGRFVKGQSVPVKITYFGTKGDKLWSNTLPSFPYKDTLMVSFLNSKDIKKIEVTIDPNRTISELNIRNNTSELEIDWDFIADKFIFSSANNKDVIAPLLSVQFNGRQVTDKQKVANNPVITFTVADDRQIFADTALVDIFIKRCGDSSCEFKKVLYSKIDMTIDPVSDHSFQINYLTKDFSEGDYELLVSAKDHAGNTSVQPYRIGFRITEDLTDVPEIVVSPNPASTYVKFNVKAGNEISYKSAKLLIYNQSGKLVDEKLISLPANAITTEWYWLPSSVSSGLYAYKVVLMDHTEQSVRTLRGKIVLVK
ncbi:C25 family cysteine peptidase [Dyadobacter sp. CY323]|uniref:putative type IX secretion system sortase PorU2 n=1 Tax=Dyadobacter sp. CY323 TaxID=2907302 RepID=UPI001F42C776|nr:C25 family cysteine peptidase [Dyadobacter sp. CY323]MCE6988230.1 C25 family cysteine peptidase [Dyadobacter sp. CY323]